jgi:hypothetical protein
VGGECGGVEVLRAVGEWICDRQRVQKSAPSAREGVRAGFFLSYERYGWLIGSSRCDYLDVF